MDTGCVTRLRPAGVPTFGGEKPLDLWSGALPKDIAKQLFSRAHEHEC